MISNSLLGAVSIFAISVSAPAFAQTTPASAAPPVSQKPVNPNERICQKQEVIGSRVQTRKVCMTRAQWADVQLQDRQNTERVQSNQGLKGE